MVLQRKDDGLLEKLVSHKELFASSGNVSIVVLDSHTSESGLLHLDSDGFGQIKGDLDLLSWVHSRVGCGGEDVEAFVSDLVNHIYYK